MIDIKTFLRRLRYEQGIYINDQDSIERIKEAIAIGLEAITILSQDDEVIVQNSANTLRDANLTSGSTRFNDAELGLLRRTLSDLVRNELIPSQELLQVQFTDGQTLKFSGRFPSNGELRGVILQNLLSSQKIKNPSQTLLQTIANSERNPGTSSLMMYALGSTMLDRNARAKMMKVLDSEYKWYNKILFPIYDTINSVINWIKSLFTSNDSPPRTRNAGRPAVSPITPQPSPVGTPTLAVSPFSEATSTLPSHPHSPLPAEIPNEGSTPTSPRT